MIVGFLTTAKSLGYLKNDALNIQTSKNKHPEYSKEVIYDENKDLPKIKDYYEKMYAFHNSCVSEALRISKNGFKKETHNFKNVIKICEDESNQIKNTQIPDKLPDTITTILENSRVNLSKSCDSLVLMFENLIKAKGDFDAENNPDTMKAWGCYLEANKYNKLTRNDILEIEVLYKSMGNK